MKTEQRYAVRLGFGHEGHGLPILVASGATNAECEARAAEALQEEFGGLWAGKLRDCLIGRRAWLEAELGQSLDGILEQEGGAS